MKYITPRYINYWVRNQYGQNCVEAVYAYQTGGTHLIPWPCANVDIDDGAGHDALVYDVFPNPTNGLLNVSVVGLQKIEIVDLCGRKLAESNSSSIDISNLPNGYYFVRVVKMTGSSVRRIVKK